MDRNDYHRAAELADKVLRKNNGFLDGLPFEDVRPDGYLPVIQNWVTLRGWRLTENEDKDRLLPAQAVGQWLRGASLNGSTAVVYLQRERERINLRYGTTGQTQPGSFAAHLPRCQLERSDWFRPRNFPFNGFLLGTVSAERLADALAADPGLQNVGVAVIACPIADRSAETLLQQEEAMLHKLEGCTTFDRVYGSATRRVVHQPVGHVGEAVTRLNAELKQLREARSLGLVYTVVKFGAADEPQYRRVKALLTAAMQAESGEAFEPLRCFTLNCEGDALAVPTVMLDGEALSLLSLNTVAAAARFCQPPQRSYPGYYLEGANNEEIFAAAMPTPVQRGDLIIGTAIEGGAPVSLKPRELLSHSFISGSNGSGKTTLVKNLLREDARLGVPFVVLELAKKEYHLLKSEIPALRVYGSGADSMPLRMNPLQPESNVLIEAHVEAVVRSLCASTGTDHPLPECFQAIFRIAYARCGWNYGELAHDDPSRRWPTFSDVLALVEPYMARYGKYGPEVRRNVTTALKIRCQHYTIGALGALFDCRSGLTAADLLRTPTVIELADFSADSIAFLSNLLLFKMQCCISHQEETHDLRHMIVVEEAHNAFRKSQDSYGLAEQNNLALAKMLAEVRAYGAAVVVADQCANLMPDAVLSNSCVKIALSQDSALDRDVMASAMDLYDRQRRELRALQPGEAVLSVRGRRDVVHFTVSAPAAGFSAPAPSAACLHCGCAQNCRRDLVAQLLAQFRPEERQRTAAALEAAPYEGRAIARAMEDLLRKAGVNASPAVKLCLLGLLLQQAHTPDQCARLIVTTYRKEIIHE